MWIRLGCPRAPRLYLGARAASWARRHDDRWGVSRDRKSTRLNSSHSQISYAVFCLKKKMPSLLADPPPSFITTPTLRPMKVVDLATHTSGLTYGFMMRTAVDAAYRKAKVADRQTAGGLPEMVDQLAQIPLDFSPGTAWNYSVSIDVLGYLVEKLSGMSFGEFLRTRLFVPLGMSETEFWVPSEKHERFTSGT